MEKNAETRQSEQEEQEEVENMVEEDSVVDEYEYEPFKDLFDQNSYRDSRRAARDLFSMLIKPLDVDSFFRYSNQWVGFFGVFCLLLLGFFFFFINQWNSIKLSFILQL